MSRSSSSQGVARLSTALTEGVWQARQFSSHVKKLLQEFPFIHDLSEVVQSQIADICHHATAEKNEILFHQGDLCDRCFIVLVGELQIWQRKDAHMEAPEHKWLEGHESVRRHAEVILSFVKEESQMRRKREEEELGEEAYDAKDHHLSRTSTSLLSRTSTLSRRGSASTTVRRRRSEDRQSIKSSASHSRGSVIRMAVRGDGEWDNAGEWQHNVTLGGGMMCGEVGLLEDQLRNATVRCNTQVELLVINKVDFDRVLKAEMNKLRFLQLAGPMRQFLKEFEFFKVLDHDVQVQVPEILQFVHYKEGSLVFREGDVADHIYIILTGEVSVWRMDAAEVEHAPSAPPASRLLKMKTAAMLTRLREKEDYKHSADWIDPDSDDGDLSDLGAVVYRFGQGHIFGEQALIEDRPRNASITCTRDCEFLSLDKDEFHALLTTRINEANLALPSLIQPLIQKVPFFQALNAYVQENIAFTMHYITEPRGKVLYWEGDAPNYCYLILSGQVSEWHKTSDDFVDVMRRSNAFHPSSGSADVCAACNEVLAHISEIEKPTNVLEIIRHAKSQKKLQEEEQSYDEEQKRTSVADKINSLLHDTMGLQERVLGQGCIIGDYALLNDTKRPRTMMCQDTCKFLVLSKVDFDRVVKEEALRSKVKQLASVVRRLLKEFDLFKDLDPSVQENLSEIVRYSPMPAGQVIFEQGDAPDLCYIVLKGEVTVWNTKPPATHRRAEYSLADGEEDQQERSPHGGVLSPRSPTSRAARPPIDEAGLLAREKCSALASMLRTAGGVREKRNSMFGFKNDVPRPLERQASDASTHFASNEFIEATCNPVAALGPGALFGELALMNDHPRNATVSCYTPCEFLVMGKKDFDAILKAEMKKVHDRKLAFLKGIVPGVRNLPTDMVERILYYFAKETVPRNHFFLEQGEVMDGSIYFIWQGSAESYRREPGKGGLLRRGIMLEGSVFASVPQNSRSHISIVATSSPCEVLHVKPENRKHLPECVIRSLRDVLDNTISRRSSQCLPLSPMGSVFEPTDRPGTVIEGGSRPGFSTSAPQQVRRQLPRPRSGKVPRPMSGKIPAILTQGPSVSGTPLAQRIGKQASQTFTSLPSFAGLFQRELTEVDYEAFELDPGETMAMKAKKPKRRQPKTLNQSSSLPALNTTSSGFSNTYSSGFGHSTSASLM